MGLLLHGPYVLFSGPRGRDHPIVTEGNGPGKDPRVARNVVPSRMDANLSIHLERPAGISLSEQIRRWISAAIHDGRLQAGARLPSWRDLAAELGVARGAVRAAS